MSSYLPQLLAARTDLQTAINRIDAYERYSTMAEWGANVAEKQLGAYHTICARVIQAYNRLDLNGSDREKLVKIAEQLRTENIALKTLAERKREQLKHLNAAVERAAMGRAA